MEKPSVSVNIYANKDEIFSRIRTTDDIICLERDSKYDGANTLMKPKINETYKLAEAVQAVRQEVADFFVDYSKTDRDGEKKLKKLKENEEEGFE